MSVFSNLFSSLSGKTSNKNRVVGLDLGSSSIKVVEVENRSNVLTLTTYGEIQLGPYADKSIGEALTLDAKREQQALIDILRESAVKANSGVFAMPLSSSFVTTIHFEADPKEDLGPRVRVESRKYIPVPINEVTLDWAEISDGSSKNKQGRDVLVAAIQNSALARFKTLMQFVNLKEPLTEIECFSTIRSTFDKEEKRMAIIDVGALSTKLFIAKDGLLQRMHRIRAGGTLATNRIADTLDCTFSEAEELKRSLSRDHMDYVDVVRAHHSVYERPFLEYKQVIREYEEMTGGKVGTIFLAGSGSLFPGFKQMVADTLQCEVRFLNPFTKVSYPAFMEDMVAELGPTFHVALGAALRAFE